VSRRPGLFRSTSDVAECAEVVGCPFGRLSQLRVTGRHGRRNRWRGAKGTWNLKLDIFLLTYSYEKAFPLFFRWSNDKFHHCCPGKLCGDRKARAASAQSFTLWQQATIEITRRDHSVIACSRHVCRVLFFAHIPFVVIFFTTVPPWKNCFDYPWKNPLLPLPPGKNPSDAHADRYRH